MVIVNEGNYNGEIELTEPSVRRGAQTAGFPIKARRRPFLQDVRVGTLATPKLQHDPQAVPSSRPHHPMAHTRFAPSGRRTPLHPGFATLRRADPVLTRNNFSAFTTYRLGAIGLLFAAYIFNVHGTATFLNNFFSSLNTRVESHSDSVVRLSLDLAPLLALCAGIVLVALVVAMFLRSVRASSKARRLNRRPCLTLAQFVDLTAAHGISVKVAREAQKLLFSAYGGRFVARLGDRLSDDLHLGNNAIVDLYANLLRQSDRIASAHDFQEAQLSTVLDLLRSAENAPQHSLRMTVPQAMSAASASFA